MAVPFPAASDLSEDQTGAIEEKLQSSNRFYQTHSGAAFSRSAAKRQSVMALPSIKYLQHQYTKLGLSSAPSNPSVLSAAPLDEHTDSLAVTSSRPSTLRLASGGRLASLRNEDLPPSPAKPTVDRRMPWELEGASAGNVKAEKDLRREVQSASNATRTMWRLDGSSPSAEESPELLLIDILAGTTSTVRSVQSWLVSLPSHQLPALPSVSSAIPGPSTSASLLHPGPEGLRRASSAILPARSSPDSRGEDPLKQLRKASRDVLGALNDMKARYRLSPAPSTPPFQGEVQPPPLSPSMSATESSLSAADAPPHMLAESGAEVSLTELGLERELVRSLLEATEVLLARTRSNPGNSGTEMTRQRSSEGRRTVSEQLPRLRSDCEVEKCRASNLDASSRACRLKVERKSEGGSDEDDLDLEEESLPKWARPGAFAGPAASLDRAHSLLASSLPNSLSSRLISPNSSHDGRSAFLLSLSDGHLLCHAFNYIVRSSARPFGFIPEKDMHDLSPSLGAEGVGGEAMVRTKSEGERKRIGETFRRVENLRAWAAAIKLRYSISVDVSRSSAPSAAPEGVGKPPNPATTAFDPLLIARREEGWTVMLKAVLNRWVEKVVLEQRQEAGADESN